MCLLAALLKRGRYYTNGSNASSNILLSTGASYGGASECPDLIIAHPSTAESLNCQINDSCLLATCYSNSSSTSQEVQSPLQQSPSITFQLQLCSEAIHVTLSGSLPGNEFKDIRVQGLGQVDIEGMGSYVVHHWNLTSGTLQFGLEVSSYNSL